METVTFKENTYRIWEFLKNHPTEDFTAQNLADILNIPVKSVNGAFTQAIQKKDLGFREEVEVELSDGTHKKVKLLHLNENGLSITPEVKA